MPSASSASASVDVRPGGRAARGQRDRDLERGEHLAAVAARAVDQVVERRPASAVAPSASRPRSASVRQRRRGRAARAGTASTRLRSGGLTSKNGFSVVAPISASRPSSTLGQQRVLLGLVEPVDLVEEQDRALALLAQPVPGALDHLPHVLHRGADTAESGSKALLVVVGDRAGPAWSCPCPAGPRGSPTTAGRPRSAPAAAGPGRAGAPGRRSSSRVRGRSRAASGDCRRRRSSTAALNRSSDPRSAAERRVAIARTVPSRSPERSFPSGRDGDYGSALRVDRARDPNPNHDGNEDVHEHTHLEGHHRRWPGSGQRGRGRHSSRGPGRDHRGHERGRSGRPSDRERVRRAHQRRRPRSPRRKPRCSEPAAA